MLSTSKSKYEQIQTELSLQIRQGMLRPGDKLPSEQELAAAYGVSRLTVRQAIGGLVTAGLVLPIQGKGSFGEIAAPGGTEDHSSAHLHVPFPGG